MFFLRFLISKHLATCFIVYVIENISLIKCIIKTLTAAKDILVQKKNPIPSFKLQGYPNTLFYNRHCGSAAI